MTAAAFYDYDLPEHLIAQAPAPERDDARLMVVDRQTGSISHRHFRDLPEFMSPGDMYVVNNSRVLPARLLGKRERTGGKWEGLFLRSLQNEHWEVLAQTRGRPEIGEVIALEPGPLRLSLRGRLDGHWLVEPSLPGLDRDLLEAHGHVPLPPYIRKGKADDTDRARYQTVYAEKEGSVAAPTAGLHFTPGLIDRLRAKGVAGACITLHVGLGTFALIKAADPTQHQMHAEQCAVPQCAVDAIQECKAKGRRVLAVGTTVVRALESAARSGQLQAWHGKTDIFIYPPYQFRVLDGLITNFHLPKTTLLLLVSAFAGAELLQRAYEEAIRRAYRFFSYGDALLIL